MAFERYAIYWAPRAGTPLAAFAADWLGRDNDTGEAAASRQNFGLDAASAERVTRGAARYALHATIKAPFRLRDGVTESELTGAMATFCARRRRFQTGALRLHRFSRFLALVPSSDTAELDWLADSCTTHFDSFRASLNDADRARRPADMPARQQVLFEQFGYPFIFDNFMFHITLAGPLGAPEMDAVEASLAPAVEPFTAEPFAVEDLCLFGDPGADNPFTLVARCPLMR